MRNTLLLATLLSLALHSAALEVTTTAGGLQTAVTDLTSTSLTITGTLDARDFKFIVDSMPELTTLDLSAAEIAAYTDTDGALLSSVPTYPAQELPHGALMGSKVANIVLPTNLTSIGQAAFAGCEQLTAITLPSTVTTIGDYAFSHTGLTSVELPAHVTTIGKGAFARCASLTSATVHCATIGSEAFMSDTELTSVNLGNEVTTIGDGAFGGCTTLEGVTLGNECAIVSIGREAFAGSSLTSIALSAMPQLSAIGAWAFANTPIQVLEIPDGVTELGEGAFYYADHLTNATMPAFEKVGDFTFAGNSATTFIDVLAEGTSRIGAYAFYGDSACTQFVLPSTITYIGTRAMAGMTGLEQLDVLGDVALLGDSVWAGVDQPSVKLDTRRDNDVSDLFAQAEQWQDFHILHDYLMGDVNLDTRINVRDITTTVDYILERHPSVFEYIAANVLVDSVINVRDVMGLTEIILNEDYDIIRSIHGRGGATPHWMTTTNDRLTMSDLCLGNGPSTIELRLNNAQTYNALQCDLVLPDGLDLTACRATGRLGAHMITTGLQDRRYRIVAYSIDNAAITTGDDAVIQLTLEPNGMALSDNVIALENVIFADLERDYSAASYVAIIDQVTGVDDVAAPNCKVSGGVGVIVIESAAELDAQVVAMNGTMHVEHIGTGITTIPASQGVYVVVVGGKSHKVVVK